MTQLATSYGLGAVLEAVSSPAKTPPLARKLEHWCTDNDTSIRQVAKRIGVKYSTLYGQLYRRRLMPSTTLAAIAKFTKLSMEYWANDAIGWPVPERFLKARQRILERLDGLSEKQMEDAASLFATEYDLSQAVRVRRALREQSRDQEPPRRG